MRDHGYTEEELTGRVRPSLSFPGDFDSACRKKENCYPGKISSHSNENAISARTYGDLGEPDRIVARDERAIPVHDSRGSRNHRAQGGERQFRRTSSRPGGIVHVDFDNRYNPVNRNSVKSPAIRRPS